MKKITFTIIWIVLIAIFIPAIILKSCDIKIKKEPEKEQVKDSVVYVYVYINKSNEVKKIPLEEYIKGVVSCEMPGSFQLEALKAQAVAARTYAVSRVKDYRENGNPGHKKAELCDGVHCQVYKSEEELQRIKGKDWMKKYYPRICKVVDETKNLIITYEGVVIKEPFFHSTSGGKTENSEDVFVSALPYLRSVESPFEKNAPHYSDETIISENDFVQRMKKSYKDIIIDKNNIKNNIKILERSEGGRILKIKVGNKILRGRDVRSALNLRSANFTIRYGGGDIIFNTTGFGHGVGMSQWGANGMAKEGYNYEEILKHYYVGVDIKSLR